MAGMPGGEAATGAVPSQGARGAIHGPEIGPREVRFRPPLQRRGMVRRARLLERLDAVPPDVPLIVLSAPAGYGKTTALSQWADARADPVAWVTLDATDSDPVQLARHIALALHGAAGLPEAAMTVLFALRSSGRVVVLQQLSRLVHALPGPIVLVLDDVQEVRGRESLGLIQELVGDASPGLHV